MRRERNILSSIFNLERRRSRQSCCSPLRTTIFACKEMIFVTARGKSQPSFAGDRVRSRCCASESRGEAAPILARRRVKMTPARMTACRAEESDRRPLYSLSRRASDSLVETPRQHGHARRIPADTAGRKRGAPPCPGGTQWTPRSPVVPPASYDVVPLC